MKLLENYIKVLEELKKYFGIDYLDHYTLEIRDDYFSIFEGKEISLAKTEEELKNRSGDYYEEPIRKVVEKEELTLVLIDSYMGDDSFWIILKTKNKRDY